LSAEANAGTVLVVDDDRSPHFPRDAPPLLGQD
jgi:hypothetical protein